jgi:hypothetical protein
MDSCDECLRLEHRLRRSNDHYVSLILQREGMIREGYQETMTFGLVEDALREAQSGRNTAAQLLLAHRGTHEALIPGPRQQQQGSRRTKHQQSSGLPTDDRV